MPYKDTLLKEAVADAKTVREAAFANAMLTLKEQFRPQLSEVLTRQLRLDEQKKLSSSEIGSAGTAVENPKPKKPTAGSSSSSDIENPGQEVDTFGEGIDEMDMDGDYSDIDEMDGMSKMDDEDPLAKEVPATRHDNYGNDQQMDGGLDGGMGDETGLEGDDDAAFLESLIKDLEADLAQDDDGEVAETVPFGHENHLQPEGFNSVDGANDVNAGIRVEGEAEDGYTDTPPKGGVPQPSEMQSSDDDELDLDEILREVDAEDGYTETPSSVAHVASENKQLKNSLREHRAVIKLLRSRINEFALVNSKLMYSTKLFRTYNLSESMKKKIIEQFDRVTTIRESKLVYTTLMESMGGTISARPNSSKNTNIAEGVARSVSNAGKLTKRINNSDKAKNIVSESKSTTRTNILADGNIQVSRFQRLAGIKDDS